MTDAGTSGAASPPSVPPIATAPPDRRNAPPTDPQGHLLSVLSQLNEQERGYAQRVFEHLSPAAIQQWHALLLSMSVDEAVTLIRTKAQGQES